VKPIAVCPPRNTQGYLQAGCGLELVLWLASIMALFDRDDRFDDMCYGVFSGIVEYSHILMNVLLGVIRITKYSSIRY
jgi:hypothetical protein